VGTIRANAIAAVILFHSTLLGAAVANVQRETPSGSAFIAVGCVNRATQNGSLAATPGVPPATPAAADDLANSNAPTGALLLTGVVPSLPNSSAGAPTQQRSSEPPRSYVLDGARDELESHVGQQLEVTGTLRLADTKGSNAGNIAHIDVRSVRVVSATCPKPSAGLK
jgi:hypothetical protein